MDIANGHQSSLGHQKCPKCPSSDAFYRWASGDAHCFSCGYHEGNDPLRKFINRQSKTLGKTNNFTSAELPSDADYWIPEEPRRWLDKYSLTTVEKHKNRILWSEKRLSLIFPVFSVNMDLLFYQERYFGDNPKISKWNTLPRGASKDVIHIPVEYKESDRIVLVEDMISAIKVCRVENCTPLFGSDIPLRLFLRLSKLFKRAVVWMDPDVKVKACETALIIGAAMPTQLILSDKDPKYYQTNEIRKYLEND